MGFLDTLINSNYSGLKQNHDSDLNHYNFWSGNNNFSPSNTQCTEDPTYLTFKIEFGDWGWSAIDSQHRVSPVTMNLFTMNYDEYPMGLLNMIDIQNDNLNNSASWWQPRRAETKSADPGQEANSYISTSPNVTSYSAYHWLYNRNEDARAAYLKAFIEYLDDLQTNRPYLMSEISGLEQLQEIQASRGSRLGEEAIITINCYETLDQRIAGLMELYRKAAWDDLWQRWIIPENLREFKMIIYISEVRNFHKPEGQASGGVNSNSIGNILGAGLNVGMYANTQYADLVELESTSIPNSADIAPVMAFECGPCEFMISPTFEDGYTSSTSDEFKMTSIKIRVKNVKTFYGNNVFDKQFSIGFIGDMINRYVRQYGPNHPRSSSFVDYLKIWLGRSHFTGSRYLDSQRLVHSKKKDIENARSTFQAADIKLSNSVDMTWNALGAFLGYAWDKITGASSRDSLARILDTFFGKGAGIAHGRIDLELIDTFRHSDPYYRNDRSHRRGGGLPQIYGDKQHAEDLLWLAESLARKNDNTADKIAWLAYIKDKINRLKRDKSYYNVITQSEREREREYRRFIEFIENNKIYYENIIKDSFNSTSWATGDIEKYSHMIYQKMIDDFKNPDFKSVDIIDTSLPIYENINARINDDYQEANIPFEKIENSDLDLSFDFMSIDTSFNNPTQNFEKLNTEFKNPAQNLQQVDTNFQNPNQSLEHMNVDFQNPNQNLQYMDTDFNNPNQSFEKMDLTFKNPNQSLERMDIKFTNPAQNYETMDTKFTNPAQQLEIMDQNFENPTQSFEKMDLTFENTYQSLERMDTDFNNPNQSFEKMDLTFKNPNQSFEKIESTDLNIDILPVSIDKDQPAMQFINQSLEKSDLNLKLNGEKLADIPLNIYFKEHQLIDDTHIPELNPIELSGEHGVDKLQPTNIEPDEFPKQNISGLILNEDFIKNELKEISIEDIESKSKELDKNIKDLELFTDVIDNRLNSNEFVSLFQLGHLTDIMNKIDNLITAKIEEAKSKSTVANQSSELLEKLKSTTLIDIEISKPKKEIENTELT